MADAPRKQRKLRRSIALAAAALLALYLTAWPVPIAPVAFDVPPSVPMSGVLAPNQELRAAEVLSPAELLGPETILIDEDGSMIGGTHDGALLRVAPDGDRTDVIATTGGRPLGLAWTRDRRIIVADAKRGLLSVDLAGSITDLAREAAGVPFGFTDDVEVASDGRIYFSDASHKFGYGDHMLDALDGNANGRLLRYDPATGAVDVLLDDLYFANGVALSKDEDFVLVNETWRYRIRRYWLEGARRGQSDIFIEGLPGYPDGVSRDERGMFWVAIFTVRNRVGDWLAPRPFFRRMVARLPRVSWPKPEAYGLAIRIDESGAIVRALHDPGGERLRTITSVQEHRGVLYFGTLHDARIGRLKLGAP